MTNFLAPGGPLWVFKLLIYILFPSQNKKKMKKYLFSHATLLYLINCSNLVFLASVRRYGHFVILEAKQGPFWPKMRKWPYLSPEATNQKNKVTFFSSTFKSEEKKVPLVLGFLASGQRYGHFLIFGENGPKMTVLRSFLTWRSFLLAMERKFLTRLHIYLLLAEKNPKRTLNTVPRSTSFLIIPKKWAKMPLKR